MGRRILILNLPVNGHIIPTYALVAELVGRGHQVTYVTTDQFVGPLRALGAEVLNYRSKVPTSVKMTESSTFAGMMGSAYENVAIANAAEPRFASAHPDLIIYDMTAILAGRVLSITWRAPAVALAPTFVSNEHFSLLDESEMRADKGIDPAALTEFLINVADFLSSHGLDMTMTNDLFQQPEAMTVAFFPREFQIAGDTFDERYVFAGPCLGDRAFQGQWQPPNDDPVLLVSLGTLNYRHQRAFVETCVPAFAGLAWHVVVSTGTEIDPADLGSLPPNMEAHQRVPQLAILRSAKLFISHCGMGGTMEALSLGVPILGVPQMTEQTVIADRIAELGIGRKISWNIGADELRSTALELAADEAAARAVEQMRGHIQKAGGASRAADEVESYMLRAGQGRRA
jgi:MGT family glycosyltransferase